jgi:hypothetical protein
MMNAKRNKRVATLLHILYDQAARERITVIYSFTATVLFADQLVKAGRVSDMWYCDPWKEDLL